MAWVQVFYPHRDGASVTQAKRLAKVAQKAYEGQRTDSVTFVRVPLQEKGSEGSWYRIDVIAYFEWTEIR
jgi:hypothetical protein